MVFGSAENRGNRETMCAVLLRRPQRSERMFHVKHPGGGEVLIDTENRGCIPGEEG